MELYSSFLASRPPGPPTTTTTKHIFDPPAYRAELKSNHASPSHSPFFCFEEKRIRKKLFFFDFLILGDKKRKRKRKRKLCRHLFLFVNTQSPKKHNNKTTGMRASSSSHPPKEKRRREEKMKKQTVWILQFFVFVGKHKESDEGDKLLCLFPRLRPPPFRFHVSGIGSRAVIVTIELPRMTFFFFCIESKEKEGKEKSEFSFRHFVEVEVEVERKEKQNPSQTHHHPDVLLHPVVDGAIEHYVHELVEAAECARDGAVGVESDCGEFFFRGVFF